MSKAEGKMNKVYSYKIFSLYLLYFQIYKKNVHHKS